MKKVYLGLCALAVFSGLSSCFKNPVTGRSSVNVVSESDVRSMATQQYGAIIASSNLVQGTRNSEMIQRVGLKMQTAVGEYLASIGKADVISGYQWEFKLIQDTTANAWCMPGGKVAFYTGIMPFCKDENGVATVMSHEIAHAVARHGNERMSQALIQEAGGTVLSVALASQPEKTQQWYNTAYGVTSNLGLILPYSRAHETEADEMGLIFMALAGYSPYEAVAFWERMAAAGGQKPPEILSTHPSNTRRINDIKGKIPNAMKYYKGK